MGKLDGKVAYITGAARGQGRAHALRLAEDGADIVALDICAQIDAVPYALASPDDLAETARLVEERGARIIARSGDVRSRAEQQSVVDEGLSAFGHIDIVVANAGIMPVPAEGIDDEDQWHSSIDVMLTGVWHTLKATTPSMIAHGTGGSIAITSSTGGSRGISDGSGGIDGYGAAKHGIVGLMRIYANLLAPHSIRVNTVHPTGVLTDMVTNDAVVAWIDRTVYPPNALPVDAMEPADVANAVAWLASEDSRFVTGMELLVDAGLSVNTITQPARPRITVGAGT